MTNREQANPHSFRFQAPSLSNWRSPVKMATDKVLIAYCEQLKSAYASKPWGNRGAWLDEAMDGLIHMIETRECVDLPDLPGTPPPNKRKATAPQRVEPAPRRKLQKR